MWRLLRCLVWLLVLLLLLALVLLVVWVVLGGWALVLVQRVVALGGVAANVLWVAALRARLVGTSGEVSRREVLVWLAFGVAGSVALRGVRAGPCGTA